MPNYKGHLLGGVIAFTIINTTPVLKNLVPYTSVFCKLIELSLCLLGSLAPDVDIRSKGRHILDAMLLFGFFLASVFRSTWTSVLMCCIFLFTRSIGHRQITHNPFFILVVPYSLFVILSGHFPLLPMLNQKNFYVAFVTGAYSHLILDFMPKKYLPGIFFSIDRVSFKKWLPIR